MCRHQFLRRVLSRAFRNAESRSALDLGRACILQAREG